MAAESIIAKPILPMKAEHVRTFYNSKSKGFRVRGPGSRVY